MNQSSEYQPVLITRLSDSYYQPRSCAGCMFYKAKAGNSLCPIRPHSMKKWCIAGLNPDRVYVLEHKLTGQQFTAETIVALYRN